MKTAPTEFTARVVEVERLCDDVLGCVLEAIGLNRFNFTPGQHIRLSLRDGDLSEDRFYSIASPPGDDERFELGIQFGDDRAGRVLQKLKPGDCLPAWGPSGRFALRQPLRDSIFVATGAGITPLRSMLESVLPEPNGCRFELIYGARSPQRLLYRDHWEELARRYPNLRFSPTVTQPDGNWQGGSGRVQGRLETVVEGRESAVDVYFCGRPEMIAECCELLRARGVDADSLIFERY